MAKVTEKSLKARCSELNLRELKDTTFGVTFERYPAGYEVILKYRDATPPQMLGKDVSASEAEALIEGVAAGAAAVKAAGAAKPEYITRDTFVRQSGSRCPRCQTKDISVGHITSNVGTMTQTCSCTRCEMNWQAIYKLEDFDYGAVAIV